MTIDFTNSTHNRGNKAMHRLKEMPCKYTFSTKHPHFAIFQTLFRFLHLKFLAQIQHPNFSLIANFGNFDVSNFNFMILSQSAVCRFHKSSVKIYCFQNLPAKNVPFLRKREAYPSHFYLIFNIYLHHVNTV